MTPATAAFLCGGLIFCAVMLACILLRLGDIYRLLLRLHELEDMREP
jgi:hypothetical protein